jgi:hypothetical protein
MLSGCGGTVVFEEQDGAGASDPTGGGGAADTSSATSSDTGGGAKPLTCDLVAGPIDLVPAADNPPGCGGIASCEVWFGHGQHLSCPAGYSEDPFVACDIWDCLCEEDGFVANFATSEVVDTRDPERTCRYTLRGGG